MIERNLLSQCVHCGLCLDACPTYLELGTEADSPRGRIHLVEAVADGRIPLDVDVMRHLDLCTGCRACETACPSGVRFGRILEGARSEIEAAGLRSATDYWRRRALLAVFPHPARLRWLMSLVYVLRGLRLWGLIERWLPAARLVPSFGAVAAPRSTPAVGAVRMQAKLLIGCVTSVMQPEINHAAVRVLTRGGVSVDVPVGQTCCGALHAHAGDMEAAREKARANIDAFGDGDEVVVVTAAGCGAAMREYGDWLAGDNEYRERARDLAARVRDAVEVADGLDLSLGDRVGLARVTYHDACHLAHAQGVREAPRRLIRRLAGTELVELPEADLCCGSAGSYNLTEPRLAGALGRRKAENIDRLQVDCVAVANPGCAMQIRAELRKRGSSVRVAHPLELIDEALRD